MLEANALKPAHTHAVAPFLNSACDEQIGKTPLRPAELARRFRPLLPVGEQFGSQRLGVGLAHATLIEPAAQCILSFEILLGCLHDPLRRVEPPQTLPVETALHRPGQDAVTLG